MSLRRNRVGWLFALALLTPLMVWAAPPASAAEVSVQLGTPLGRDIWPGQKTSDLDVYTGQVTQNAIATFKNPAGTVVRTMSVPPECWDPCFDEGLYRGYEVDWDGTNNSGAVLPAGRYTGSIALTDADGQQTASLGFMWVNRLVTRTSRDYQETFMTPEFDALSTVGRCSSVLGPVAGTPYKIRMLSMNKCRSSAGTDDWAFRAGQVELWEDPTASRVISVRVGATGSPVHTGDTATMVVDSSAGTAPTPTWRRVVEMGRAGTYLGTVFTPPPGSMNRPNFQLLVQSRVVNGNWWRIHFYETLWTYRAWTR